MIALPPRLNTTGKNAAIYGWLNQLRECVRARTPAQSNRMRVVYTATGVQFESIPQTSGRSKGGESSWL
jgi:hypothetical protein